jgi:hypothetical protein
MIKPFQNESEAVTIGDLNVENRLDHVAVYGRLEITRDKAGLEAARQLRATLEAVEQALESEKALPDKVAGPKPPTAVKNPFG